jgi:hypothetical protein
MAQHVKILGFLHIIFNALMIFFAIVVLLFFGGIAGIVAATPDSDQAAIPILGTVGVIAFLAIFCLSLPGLIAGIGLLKFRPWARILGIIISILDLMNIPFGTALGIYGLWVLLNNQTEWLFRAQQSAMPMRQY